MKYLEQVNRIAIRILDGHVFKALKKLISIILVKTGLVKTNLV